MQHSSNRKGVSNIVLMLGVAICMAVLLIGGFLLVTKFIEAQARASPQYLTTELVTLINTVQTAPETVTFEYYTDTDENGFPIIGSLEIDDDTNRLCISPKTEDEIFSTILTKTAVAAGFGGVEYAYGKSRSAAARKSTSKIMTARELENIFPTLSENPDVFKVAMENTRRGDLVRKALLGQELTGKEERKLAAMLEKNPELDEALGKAYYALGPAEKEALEEVNQPGRFRVLDFVTKYWNGINVWVGEKVAKVNSWLVSAASRVFPESVVKFVGGTAKVVKATGKEAAFIGGLAAMQTVLTGGGWEEFKENFQTLAVYAVVPKIIEKLITTEGISFFGREIGRNPINLAFERIKDFLITFSPPGVGEATCYPLHFAQSLVNAAFTVWDWYLLDDWLGKINEAAGNAAKAERDAMYCRNFLTEKRVLLTPPNCKPKVKFDLSLGELAQGADVLAYGAAGVLFHGATTEAIATASIACTKGGYREKVSTKTLGLMAGGMASAGAATGHLIYEMSKNPLVLIPKTSCDPAPNTNTCDTTYLRQDCPNWFISTNPGALEYTQVSAIQFLINVGYPICLLNSFSSGWGGRACNLERFTFALSIFFLSPQTVYLVMLRTNEVGFTKEVNEPKTALGLEKEFANNNGFWYAELPYAIEMTKLYTNDTNINNRMGNLIIRKI